MTERSRTDFFENKFNDFGENSRGRRLLHRLQDVLWDVRLLLNRSYCSLQKHIVNSPVRDILIIGIDVPARADDLKAIMKTLSQTRHRVKTILAPMLPDKGKFQNINAGLNNIPLDAYDWLIIVDDDVAFPPNFLDRFIYLAEYAELKLCQPAHKRFSYQSFLMTQRHLGSLVRLTNYVESGPVTAFHRSLVQHVLPFPELRWAWGTDIVWAEKARQLNYNIGIVDATPIQHLRPVAASYDIRPAIEEANAYLEQMHITRPREDILKTNQIITRL